RRHRPPMYSAGGSRNRLGGSGGFLDASYVRGVQPFVSGPDLELDFLALGKRLESVHLNCGEVDEHVFAALLFNEAVTFRIIEPFHLPSSHSGCLLRGESILHCVVPGKSGRLARPILAWVVFLSSCVFASVLVRCSEWIVIGHV